jgi:hypothetical protein
VTPFFFEKYKTKNELKGASQLKGLFTPQAVKQFIPGKKETSTGSRFNRSSSRGGSRFQR